MLDTGINVPETWETLQAQQRTLIAGQRPVQMFPIGTKELSLPDGMERYVNMRGIFHFNPVKIDRKTIAIKSEQGRENEFLMLGPYSKPEIFARLDQGEAPAVIIEYASDGTELRSAAGTTNTLKEQQAYFELTKQRGSKIIAGTDFAQLPPRVIERMQNGV